MNIATILTHYIVAALWSSTDNADDSGGSPLDDNYSEADISPQTLAAMRKDVTAFVKDNEALLDESGQSDEQIGHDFWLNRNGHGAGFWDLLITAFEGLSAEPFEGCYNAPSLSNNADGST